MATSGTISFAQTRNDIITAALELVGKRDTYEATLDASLVSQGARWLNMLVKSWQNDGVFLWKSSIATLFLAPNQYRYDLGAATTNASKTITTTTLAVGAAVGEDFFTLTSATGVNNGDVMGIMQDNGVLFWDGIASLVGVNVGTNAPGLDVAAAAGSKVYAYRPANRLARPLDVLQATYRIDDGTNITLRQMNRDEYLRTPRDAITGTPSKWYFDRRRDGSSYLYIWPTPADSRALVELDVKEIIEDFTIATDEPDFPQQWFMALAYGLAVHLGRINRLPADEMASIEAAAAMERKKAAMLDRQAHYTVEVP